ncbi:MAG: histidine kinase [Saprospiraceae bacterium]|nr:histidine kinase [Saprospiraceae bacterium]
MLAIFLWFSGQTLGLAQDTLSNAMYISPAGELKYETIYRWDRNQGLPGGQLLQTFKDSLGFYWFVTEHAVSRFDGERFLDFTIKDQDKHLAGAHIQKVWMPDLQHLWVFYDDRQNGYDRINTTNLSIAFENYPIANIVRFFPLDHGRSIWITGNQNEIEVYLQWKGQSRMLKVYKPSAKWDPNEIIVRTTPESILVGNLVMDTLLLVHENQMEQVPVRGKLNAIAPQGRRDVLLTYSYVPGMFKLDLYDLSIAYFTYVSTSEYFGDGFLDEQGNAVFSIRSNFKTPKGYIIITPQNDVVPLYLNIDGGEIITDLYSDNIFNEVALATPTGAYYLYKSGNKIHNLFNKRISKGQWGAVMRGIAEAPDGAIYAVREFDVLYRVSQDLEHHEAILVHVYDSVQNRYLPLSCSSDLVFTDSVSLWGSICDNDQNAYIYRFNTQSRQSRLFWVGAGMLVRDFTCDRARNALWLAVRRNVDNGGLLIRFDLSTHRFELWKNNDLENPLDDAMPNCVKLDSTGQLWLGTQAGLFRLDPEKNNWRQWTKADQLNNEQILDINIVKPEIIGLGTENGFFLYDPQSKKTLQRYDADAGLNNLNVCSILRDESGNFWLGTFNGLSFINVRDGLITNYLEQSGISHNEFNRLSVLKDHKGRFYFGGMNGVNVFFPDQLRDKDQGNGLRLVAINQLNRNKGLVRHTDEIPYLKEITMRPSDVFLELQFYHQDNMNANNMTLAYKIQEAGSWNITKSDRIRIEQLSPGLYTLRIRGTNLSGNWLEEEWAMPIRVRNVFYKSPFFILFLLVGSGALIYGYLKRRTMLIAEEERQKALITKRFAELEMQALQAQMNPHFIFNALSAIQYFVHSNNKKACELYITKFAFLIRSVLEASKNKYITLRDELRIISTYVELERMRFNNKFDFDMEVDPSVKDANVQIPALFLQPFIENSINHGLFHKKDKGNLQLKVFQEGSNISILIQDNGIGRLQSVMIKEKSIGAHRSRGLQMMEERKEVYQKVDGYHLNFNIEDLFEGGKPSGTKVLVNIPIFEN